MTKPREWWIVGEENEDHEAAFYTKHPGPRFNPIHVIEYSAYEYLALQIEDLYNQIDLYINRRNELKAKLSTAIEALERADMTITGMAEMLGEHQPRYKLMNDNVARAALEKLK